MASGQMTLALVLVLALMVGSSATFRRPPKPTAIVKLVSLPGQISATPDFINNITTGYATVTGTLYGAPPPPKYGRVYAKGPYPTPQPVPVGVAYGTLTVVTGGQFPVLLAAFTWEIIGKGQITTFGYINRALPSSKFAITGGTDTFQVVDGEVVVSSVPVSYPGAIAEMDAYVFAVIDD